MQNYEYLVDAIDVDAFKIWFFGLQKTKPEWVEFLLNYQCLKNFWEGLKTYQKGDDFKSWVIHDEISNERILCCCDLKTGFMTYKVQSVKANPHIILHAVLLENA